MDSRVVDAAGGDDDGFAAELRHGIARHLEVLDDAIQRCHRHVGSQVDARRADVAVEDHVEVLVIGDPRQQLLGHRLVARLAGVAVRHPGGEFLEADVHDRVEQRLGEQVTLHVLAGGEAPGHLLHPQFLEFHRIAVACDYQVVADGDSVPVLLRRPPVDPVAPGAVHGEVHRDLAVVGRQVVLGEQVLHQCGAGNLGQLRLLGVPVLAAEGVVVLAVRPRDVVVGVPILEHRHVAVDEFLRHRLECVKQLEVGHLLGHTPSRYLCRTVASIYLCRTVTFKSRALIRMSDGRARSC